MTVMLRVLSTWGGFVGAPGYTNTYWRPGTGGGSVADATDCVARVRALWIALAPSLPTAVTIQVAPLVEAVEDTTGALTGAFAASPVAVVNGSGGASWAARGSAWVLQAKTNLIVGRRFLRGHTFLAPLAQIAFTNASGDPNGFAATQTAANAMLTGGGTASFPVIWGRPVVTPFRAGTSGPVTVYTVSTKAGVLRSRRD